MDVSPSMDVPPSSSLLAISHSSVIGLTVVLVVLVILSGFFSAVSYTHLRAHET